MLRICAKSIQGLALRASTVNTAVVSRGFCEKIEKNEIEPVEHAADEKKLSGFAKAFEKHSAPVVDESQQKEEQPDLPFATLLRNSKLINVS